MPILYTTTAIATGDGRNGHVQTTDGLLDTDVRLPVELGGAGGATNPEQLFAAGYAACFHSALKLVASADGVDTTDSEVVADVSLGAHENGAFGLSVALEVTLPGAEREVAEKVVARAHEVCPYSNATRGNIEVVLTVA
ncbi:organic hydroperoxide resistance protein [Nocardioides limicola]|uniref:organic hydroperoxide resistance protein n=1 Tax=Nocardioides limicola TaxID=2803368 RepID=UPI00193BA2CB|nr:organic hydroperoxide resistance protein [Nocardioides sp. DJM-14]